MGLHLKNPTGVFPLYYFQEVREHLKEMLDAGAIRESESPFSSNVVLVRKKDGALRFCIDFRKLNGRTVRDAYSLPRIEETIDTLSGSKYFSKLDLRSGYWQVGIKEADKHRPHSLWVLWASLNVIEWLLACAMPLPLFKGLWNAAWESYI